MLSALPASDRASSTWISSSQVAQITYATIAKAIGMMTRSLIGSEPEAT